MGARMFRFLRSRLKRSHDGARLRDAKEAVRAARAAYAAARVRGDTRGQKDTYEALKAANNDLLRLELGR